jgi:carboxylesterase type B
MHVVSLYVLVILASTVLGAPSKQWAIGQEVPTTSGKVKGRPATRVGYEEVSEYVGIPYAHPPQGPLRWMPPKAFKSDRAIDATKWVCKISLATRTSSD